jgi:hypothetical protein
VDDKATCAGGDIDQNPGPQMTGLVLMTLNCRGVNDMSKPRLLLNNKNKKVKGEKFIPALQETYLMNDRYIKWNDNYAFTISESPHSAGCITFISDSAKILECRNTDNQGHGHVIVVEGLEDNLTIIHNI